MFDYQNQLPKHAHQKKEYVTIFPSIEWIGRIQALQNQM